MFLYLLFVWQDILPCKMYNFYLVKVFFFTFLASSQLNIKTIF